MTHSPYIHTMPTKPIHSMGLESMPTLTPLAPLAPPQLIGIYGGPMEHLGNTQNQVTRDGGTPHGPTPNGPTEGLTELPRCAPDGRGRRRVATPVLFWSSTHLVSVLQHQRNDPSDMILNDPIDHQRDGRLTSKKEHTHKLHRIHKHWIRCLTVH